jgi:alpha-galactosidase
MKNKWFRQHLADAKLVLPFSFTYDGQPSAKLLAEWPAKVANERLDAQRTRRTISWTDPKTRLEVKCVAVDYADYPVVEWTVFLKNTGTADTPVLEDVQALDAQFARTGQGGFVLHGHRGDFCTADSFHPFDLLLGPGATQRFNPMGGRGSNFAFPYYNLELGGGGVALAIGWPGQWAASFVRDMGRGLRVVAGQERTHLVLKPGEEIRTPLLALLFWQGTDRVQAQNLWRRWMVAHNLPRMADGNVIPPQVVACSSHMYEEMAKADEASQKMFVDRYIEEGMKLDYWWMDAGWYPCKGHWTNTGTWEVDKTRFPNGLRAVTDHARTQGVKTILWFEPERIGDKESWLATKHPEWLLEGRLLNLGNPAARQWVTDHVDGLIKSEGIDFYRQDFNMDPLGCWTKNDTPNRIGATENFYVQGYLAYWDELRRRHPGLPIDSCASGGRRNDLETMRRAVPLIRSDHLFEPTSQQCHHYAYASWIPYHGAGYPGWGQNHKIDAYEFRSNVSASMTLCFDMRIKELDYDLLRWLYAEARQINGYYTADFHPLTPYDLREDAWMAWQYHRPDAGDGMIQVFRRPKNGEVTRTFRLGGLDPKAKYEVVDLTRSRRQMMTGSRLMKEGLKLKIADRPGAVTIVYRPVQQRRAK